MEYCPHCSGAITKPAKVCPHCKKSLNLQMYQSVYKPAETSVPNKAAIRKLWFKENSRYILPVLFLIGGMIAGVIGTLSYSALHFQSRQNAFEQEIANLNSSLQQAGSIAASAADSLNTHVLQQDTVIQIIAEKNKLLRQIIVFTRRLANNSNVQPRSESEANYFRRNFKYLERQYETQQQKLLTTHFKPEERYNLKTIPKFLED